MEIYEIAKEIAIHLDGWEAEAGSEYGHVSLYHVQNGITPEITITDMDNGKLHFCAVFPRTKYSYCVVPDGKKREINISCDKTVVMIARSLKKRLLDEYLEVLESVSQKISKDKENEAKAQALALECKEIMGANAYCNNDWGTSNTYTITRARYNQASTTDVGVKIEIANYYAGEKGNIKIDDLPKDMLLRILKILQ